MSRIAVMVPVVLIGVALLASACTSRATLELSDPRLPSDARRSLAAAEDAVSVTHAAVDEAQRELRRAKRAHERRTTSAPWPAEGAEASGAAHAMGEARIELARRALEHAERRVALERTKFEHVTARMSIRYELGAYALDPLREAETQAREAVTKADRAVTDYREQVAEAERVFWEAYARYVAAGGDRKVLW